MCVFSPLPAAHSPMLCCAAAQALLFLGRDGTFPLFARVLQLATHEDALRLGKGLPQRPSGAYGDRFAGRLTDGESPSAGRAGGWEPAVSRQAPAMNSSGLDPAREPGSDWCFKAPVLFCESEPYINTSLELSSHVEAYLYVCII